VATRHTAAWFREKPLLLELGQGPLDDCSGLFSTARLTFRNQRSRDLVERRSVSFAGSPDAGSGLGQAMCDIPRAVIDQELVAKLLNR
jgi:hypothetical protein